MDFNGCRLFQISRLALAASFEGLSLVLWVKGYI
jgi:hypothetical protein